jgi:Ca2+-binding EF-hand superfamily protein
MLHPVVTEHYDQQSDQLLSEDDPRACDANKFVMI